MPRLDPVLTGGYGVAVVAPQGGRLVEFQVLGPFQIVREGRPVALGGYKQRALLALLLLERHRVVSHDRLVDALWGERPPPSARNSVQVYVSRLRRVLAGEGGDEELLVRQPTGYLLRAPAEAVDAERFERLLMEGVKAFHAGGAEPAEETLARALALWRGP